MHSLQNKSNNILNRTWPRQWEHCRVSTESNGRVTWQHKKQGAWNEYSLGPSWLHLVFFTTWYGYANGPAIRIIEEVTILIRCNCETFTLMGMCVLAFHIWYRLFLLIWLLCLQHVLFLCQCGIGFGFIG